MSDSPAVPPPPEFQQPSPAPGWGPVGKVRNPWAVIGLSIITLGIYFLYWTYQVFREMKDHSGDGIGGPIGLVIGILIGIVNVFLIPSEVGNIYAKAGQPEAGLRPHRLLDFHSADRVLHLDDQGPERAQQPLGDRRRCMSGKTIRLD